MVVQTFSRTRVVGITSLTVIAAFLLPHEVAHAQTYALSTVADFNGTNGKWSYAGVTLDSSGNLYGTTSAGGASGDGTVFKIAAGTNTITTLASFTSAANGSDPEAGVVLDSSGNLFGTTKSGGANNYGTVFKIAAGSNALSTVVTFTGAGNPSTPESSLTIDNAGNLYGTTFGGGANGQGVVYKIAAGASTLTTLATFSGASTGANPIGGVTLDGSGNLYGTTAYGGASNVGTAFKIAAGTNTLTKIATFTGTANGSYPEARMVIDGSGNLYGVTQSGGASNYGTLFKIAAGTNTLTTLVTFNYANGAYPYGDLTTDSAGNLYGTTYAGGTNGVGTVFKYTSSANALTTLAAFTGSSAYPYGGVTLDNSGNLYGTTYLGGANSQGMVFKLTPVGSAAPEPAALALLLPAALPLLAAGARRRRNAAA